MVKENKFIRNGIFSNRDLIRLIVPLVIEQALMMLVGVADTLMVSYAGEAAVSGVALVDMINYLIITLLSALSTGGAVIVSQYLGSGDTESCNSSAGQLIMIAAVVSAGIMILCLIFPSVIIDIAFGSIESDVRKAAMTYFIITALSFPFLGIYDSLTAVFRSMQKTNVTMYVSVIVNIINIIGNGIGVFVLHAGVAGVAVPTLVSRGAGAVLMLVMSFNRNNKVSVHIKNIFAFKRNIVKRILYIAVPNGIENGLFALGRLAVTGIVALFGTSQIAANGVASGVDSIAIVVVNGMNLAIITVVGQCMGAGEVKQAEKYTKKLMKISYVSTGILSAAVWIMLPFILNLYQLSEETRRLSYILVMIHNILAFLLHPTSFNLANSLRAAGDVKITMVTGVISMLVFRIFTAYVLGIHFGLGIIGVWIAMGVDWFVRSVAFVIRYMGGKWKRISVI